MRLHGLWISCLGQDLQELIIRQEVKPAESKGHLDVEHDDIDAQPWVDVKGKILPHLLLGTDALGL